MKHNKEKKSILVIGMGRVGYYLALRLQELGNHVMVVDEEQSLSPEISSIFSDYLIGDSTSESFISALGVSNFDICFVTIGEDFEASVIITSLLKSHGAKRIVTKAGRDIHAEVLKKVGADEVVYPERELAEKLAVRYDMRNIFDFISLSEDYGIYEIAVPDEWVGHRIGELEVRKKFKINILLIKNEPVLMSMPGVDYTFKTGDVLVVMGKSGDVFEIA